MKGRKPIVQCTAGEWREITRAVQACAPAPDGYVWRFVWCRTLPEDRIADCNRIEPKPPRRGVFAIRVLRGMSRHHTEWALIHEMAHAFDMWTHHAWSDHGDHSGTFWIWHGRIFRRYYV